MPQRRLPGRAWLNYTTEAIRQMIELICNVVDDIP